MTTTEEQETQPWVLLLVDDEPNVLSALRRVLRPLAARLLTADNGRKALEILEREPVDLILSDMRMPEMDGAALLAEASRRWPDRARLLLTGHADLSATIDAINKGHIDRYLTKPWEDNDLRLSVRQAVEARRLRLEQKRLTIQIHQRNKELRRLNSQLGERIHHEGTTARHPPPQAEQAVIDTLVGLMELRHRPLAEHGKRVAYWARRIAERMELSPPEVEVAYRAGLLHDLGKIGLPDELLDVAQESLAGPEREQLVSHPALGQAYLGALPWLSTAAVAIRAHHERYDGGGFPDRLAGEEIPVEARIVALSNDYDSLQMGTLFEGRVLPSRAQHFLHSHRGKRYDPEVVEAFEMLLAEDVAELEDVVETRRLIPQLKEGMVVTRELRDARGYLLLPRGQRLSWPTIGRLEELEREAKTTYLVYVRDYN